MAGGCRSWCGTRRLCLNSEAEALPGQLRQGSCRVVLCKKHQCYSGALDGRTQALHGTALASGLVRFLILSVYSIAPQILKRTQAETLADAPLDGPDSNSMEHEPSVRAFPLPLAACSAGA